MASAHLPIHAKDNEMRIPTICLDSMYESGAHLDSFGNSSSECQSHDEQSIGPDVAHFLSSASCFGSLKKFIAGIALLSQCDPSYRCAAVGILQSDLYSPNAESAEGSELDHYDCDYVASLQWGSLPPATFIDELLKLLQCVTRCLLPMPRDQPHVHSSAADSYEKPNGTVICTHLIPPKHEAADSCPWPDPATLKAYCLKRHFLRLFAEAVCHADEFTDQVDDTHKGVSVDQSCSTITKVNFIRSPLGQLTLKMMLNPVFTNEDRNWLLSTLFARRRLFFEDLVSDDDQRCVDGPCLDTRGALKLFDYVLDFVFDMATVMQSCPLGSERSMSSLSPSLTSSGFLSGSGGPGSQYDLSEATNPIGHSSNSSHYGTLLTVPSSDHRATFAQHLSCSPSSWSGGLDQRRLSDVPFFSGTSTATNANIAGLYHPRKPSDLATIHAGHLSLDRTLESAAYHHRFPSTRVPPLSRSSLPNALTPNSPVGPITERTSDSVSLSSTSSTFSSSLELETGSVHRMVSSATSSAVNVGPLTTDGTTSSQSPIIQAADVVLRSIPPQTNIPTMANTETTYSVNSSASNHGSNEPETDKNYFAPTTLGPLNFCKSSQDSSDHKLIVVSPSTTQSNEINGGSDSLRSVNSYCDPTSGMSGVPLWLRGLRLHKYSGLFERLTYDEFMNISETWLEERNVTQGARTKLLLSIRKLSTRVADLRRAEYVMLQAPTSGPGCLFALNNCLSEIWNVLQTPIKPCFLAPESPEEHSPSTEGHCSLPVRNSFQGGTDGTISETQIHHRATEAYIHPPHKEHEDECLPSQIMSCLTKVCSRLLVSPEPDSTCCTKFVQLLDIVSEHPAFPDKHRSLTTSWKQQLFSMHDFSSCGVMLDTTQSFYFAPSPRHMTKSDGKHSAAVDSSQFRGSRNIYRSSVEPSSWQFQINQPNENFGSVSSDVRVPSCNAHTFPNACVKNRNELISNRPRFPVEAFDDSWVRRHSVPINHSPVNHFNLPIGRRMPSPNLGLIPGRRGRTISPMGKLFFPGQAQASSVADVSQFSTQLSRACFPSPSMFDACNPSGSRRNLVPPATAPPTRMPSPSGIRGQESVTTNPEFSMSPSCFGQCVQALHSCSSTLFARTVDAPHFPQLIRFQPPNVSIDTKTDRSMDYPKEFHRDNNSLLPPSPSDVPGGSWRLNSHFCPGLVSCRDATSFFASHSNNMQPQRCPSQHDLPFTAKSVSLQGSCTLSPIDIHSRFLVTSDMKPSRPGFSSRPDLRYSGERGGQVSTKLSSVRQPITAESLASGSATTLEHIERNLELLTRNVTELAIGEFDSPLE